jgi:hypothetical protein
MGGKVTTGNDTDNTSPPPPRDDRDRAFARLGWKEGAPDMNILKMAAALLGRDTVLGDLCPDLTGPYNVVWQHRITPVIPSQDRARATADLS